MRCALLPGLPNNEGMFRPIKVVAPEGSLLNPRFPAAVGQPRRHRALRAGAGAGRAAPGDPRARDGRRRLAAVGRDASRACARTASRTPPCCSSTAAWAPRPVKDGENVLSWPSNISSTPVEVAERNSPLFFHYKRLRAGSGGDGRYPRRARPGHPDREPLAPAHRAERDGRAHEVSGAGPGRRRRRRPRRRPHQRQARSTTASSTSSSAATASWSARRAAAATARHARATPGGCEPIARSAMSPGGHDPPHDDRRSDDDARYATDEHAEVSGGPVRVGHAPADRAARGSAPRAGRDRRAHADRRSADGRRPGAGQDRLPRAALRRDRPGRQGHVQRAASSTGRRPAGRWPAASSR